MIKFGKIVFERQARSRILSCKYLWSVSSVYITQTNSTECRFVGYEALHICFRQAKTREILEFGTGTSTVVLSYALKENESVGYYKIVVNRFFFLIELHATGFLRHQFSEFSRLSAPAVSNPP